MAISFGQDFETSAERNDGIDLTFIRSQIRFCVAQTDALMNHYEIRRRLDLK